MQLIGMADVGGTHLLHPRAQEQQVVVFRRGDVPAGDVGDHEEQASGLELPIGEPLRPEHLRPADLEVGDEVGVMHPALAVGLLVADADFDLVHV